MPSIYQKKGGYRNKVCTERKGKKRRLTIPQHHRKFKLDAPDATGAKSRLCVVNVHGVDDLLASRRHRARRRRSVGTSRKGRSIGIRFDFEVAFLRCNRMSGWSKIHGLPIGSTLPIPVALPPTMQNSVC